ncbi:MAG TPA: hypothetical protein VH986_10295 [Acidimicrobiia bacterium]|jgi:hypothetical protein
MAFTQVRPEAPTTAPPVPPARPTAHDPRTETREWLNERIPGAVAAAVAVTWFVLVQIAFALEPATNRSVPVIGVMLEVAMYLLLAVMITGLVMQRRWGLAASLAGAVLATAASIACPVTGHHPFGTWWFGQMACMLGLVAVSVVTLRRQYADV